MQELVATFDVAHERAALVGLLMQGDRMAWSPLRDRLVAEESLPSSQVSSNDEILFGREILETWQSQSPGASFYCYLDSGFPPQLRTVWDFPPFVFLKGDEKPVNSSSDDRGVCIVGSRKPHPDSVRATKWIARGLVERGITIISGLAEGIDRAAHSAALDMGARTVGVIGTGIDKYYPASSRSIQQRMENGEGMVISQFKPGASPTRSSFPMRNGLMSAYGEATIIVEASEKSGTRHQAKQAVKHGRPLILSPQVARETSWGRELSTDPLIDARVGETLDETVEIAVNLVQRQESAGLGLAL